VRRLLDILLDAATVLSLVLCVAAAVLWVRSYRSIDRVTHTSARLLESLALIRERGSWKDRSTKSTRTTEDYAQWPGASSKGVMRPWLWRVKPYDRAALLAEAWGPDLHRALPAMTVIDLARQRTFNNADGSLLTYRLIGRRVWLPYWLVVASTGLLPAWRMIARHRRSRRSRLKLCSLCGYDLRATPDRCPECGKVPAPLPS
jgi:hypothetical protein